LEDWEKCKCEEEVPVYAIFCYVFGVIGAVLINFAVIGSKR